MLLIGKNVDMAPRAEATAAVVVTYHPDAELDDRLRRVRSQVAYVVIVDNSATPTVSARLRQLTRENVELIENDRNVGVAAALNRGLRRAAALNLAWVLMLDQDSVVDDDMLASLIHIYHECPSRDRIGLIGANSRSPISGRMGMACGTRGREYVETKTTITSGSLVALSIYERVGPFRDDFFIEGVDLEYCLRLRRHGFAVLCSRRPLMTHAGGTAEERSLFGRAVLIANHEPWRYYYMLRNFVDIVRHYAGREPLWVVAALVNFLKTFVKIWLFERNRVAKFAAMGRGIGDGILGSRRSDGAKMEP